MSILARGLGLGLFILIAAGPATKPNQPLNDQGMLMAGLLPPPAAEGSPETKAELDLILRLQDHRTPEQVARLKADAQLTVSAFSEVLGPWCTPENLPRTQQLLQQLEKEARTIGEQARTHFGRKRPRFLDDRIKPALEGLDDPCYPSGNAMRGMVYAVVLAELVPEQKEAIFERGRELGWNRVVAGVHYPSDIIAGRVLGLAQARSALAKAEVQEEMVKAKAEVAAARQLPVK